jgi:hypothetical protein
VHSEIGAPDHFPSRARTPDHVRGTSLSKTETDKAECVLRSTSGAKKGMIRRSL